MLYNIIILELSMSFYYVSMTVIGHVICDSLYDYSIILNPK